MVPMWVRFGLMLFNVVVMDVVVVMRLIFMVVMMRDIIIKIVMNRVKYVKMVWMVFLGIMDWFI